MEHRTRDPLLTEEAVERAIRTAYPDLEVSTKKSLLGRRIIVQKTKAIGAAVSVKSGRIVVTEIIPSPMVAGVVGGFGLLGLAVVRVWHRKGWREFHSTFGEFVIRTF
jgi:hypothetical protein